MRAASEFVDSLRGLTRQQQLLRAAIVGGAVGAIAAVEEAGDVSGPALVVMAAAIVVAVARPDSHATAVAIIAFGFMWFAGVDDAMTPWTVVAAACLLLIHSAAALAAIAPPMASAPRALLERWGARAGIVLAAAVVAFLGALALDEVATRSSVVLATGGTLALLAVVRLLWPREA